MPKQLSAELLLSFQSYLRTEERSAATIQKYLHALNDFTGWLNGSEVSKEKVSQYKETLLQEGRAAVSINGILAALHSFFSFMGWQELRVKYLKLQRRVFREAARDLSKSEYLRLVQAAKNRQDRRLALVLETICATGVRVSEVRYITVEAARAGRADISMKGKIRTILIPEKLAQKLLRYAEKQKIASGEVFLTGRGTSLSRQEIWRRMKNLCNEAGVPIKKVFPHNLRHLFARSLYQACRDIVRVADVLGHSSVETTRIYLITTGDEYSRQLESLGLIC